MVISYTHSVIDFAMNFYLFTFSHSQRGSKASHEPPDLAKEKKNVYVYIIFFFKFYFDSSKIRFEHFDPNFF